MKLKLDLHPIFSDSQKIEQSLNDIVAEAVAKRATEIEIIPGKGSGALKKSVLRFLERPEIKSQYHRVEKDDENFGRIFVHFRFAAQNQSAAARLPKPTAAGECFCCRAEVTVELPVEPLPGERTEHRVECPSCGSPNLLTVTVLRNGKLNVRTDSGYETTE
jgi:hypothetical protein